MEMNVENKTIVVLNDVLYFVDEHELHAYVAAHKETWAKTLPAWVRAHGMQMHSAPPRGQILASVAAGALWALLLVFIFSAF
jgi:hypothetical protein